MKRCNACNGLLERCRLGQESSCSKRCRDKYRAEEEIRASLIKACVFLAQRGQRTPQVNSITGKVLKFRHNDVFFPEITAAMGEAYDAAIATLPPDARSVFYFHERIAKRIMKAAYAGEIDREQLRRSGLMGFHKLTKGGGNALVAPIRAALPENTF